MKTLTRLLITLALSTGAYAGTVNFVNSSFTLISAEGVPMPPATNSLFYFALFLAPSDTVTEPEQHATFWTDPIFQTAAAYNTNHTFAAGRLNGFGASLLEVGGVTGQTNDFLVRGWSANAGMSWEEASANYNGGTPLLPMYVGESTIANNIILGGGPIPSVTLFGVGDNQIRGFNMILVPEPSIVALTLLGLVGWRMSRRSGSPRF